MADPIDGGGSPAPSPAPAPAAAPAAAPAPASEPRGIAAALAKLTPVPDAPAPIPKAEPSAPAVEPKGAPAPAAGPEADVVGEGLWRTAPKHLKNDHYKTKRELETKLGELEKKAKELEGKATQSPADLAKIKANDERIAQLEKDLQERESRLIQADYSKSDEFKRLYIDKGAKAYAKAIGEIKSLKVKVVDGEGNESDRPATQADFDSIRKLEPYDQDRKIHEMFGTSASRVALHLNILNSIESEANDAILNANEKSAAARREADLQRESFNGEFKTHSEAAMSELTTKFKEFFAPDETNPEASKALEGGYSFVDETVANTAKMSPKERAESTAIIRGLAAAAPRLMVEKKQLVSKVKALEEEISKFRKSAPGAASPGASSPAPAKELRGIAAAVAASVQQPA
jgi:hypothetical protein